MIKSYKNEIFVLVLYALCLSLTMYYHEPWLDEAQAWLIAQDASPIELVKHITHFEGHPPAWFLMLMPLAKIGIPFEWGIKFVNFSMATLAMAVFIFKSPFPFIIRSLAPFTYFFFYQYGVICRPYSMMMLGFFLSALFYKRRNERPFAYTLSLALLCSASVYGMIIAAGLVVVWLIEIVPRLRNTTSINQFVCSHRFMGLFFLGVLNTLIIWTIYPMDNTYAVNMVVESRTWPLWLTYMFLVAPSDALLSNIYSYSIGPHIYQVIISMAISYMILAVLYETANACRKKALLVIPLVPLAVFGGMGYFSTHHIGIVVMFFTFFLWCCFDEVKNSNEGHLPSRMVKHIAIIILTISIGISLYWTAIAVWNDVHNNYGTGREAAEFIKTNNLEQLKILGAWRPVENNNTNQIYFDYNYVEEIPILAYFDQNIISNLNRKSNSQRYLTHEIDIQGSYTKSLLETGKPDVLIINSDLGYTFGNMVDMDDYILVKSVQGNMIWKDKIIENRLLIFINKGLQRQYPHLEALEFKEE